MSKFFYSFWRENCEGTFKMRAIVTKIEISKYKEYLNDKLQGKNVSSILATMDFNARKTFSRRLKIILYYEMIYSTKVYTIGKKIWPFSSISTKKLSRQK
jgi:hypothetical protein